MCLNSDSVRQASHENSMGLHFSFEKSEMTRKISFSEHIDFSYSKSELHIYITELHKESESLLSVTFVMLYLHIFLPIFRYNSLKTTAIWIARQADIV